MQLKVFSKLYCFLKLEFQPKIEFLKYTWCEFLKKKKKEEEVELKFSKLEFHAFKKINPMELKGSKHKFRYFF